MGYRNDPNTMRYFFTSTTNSSGSLSDLGLSGHTGHRCTYTQSTHAHSPSHTHVHIHTEHTCTSIATYMHTHRAHIHTQSTQPQIAHLHVSTTK